MGEAFLEREELAFGRPVGAFGKDPHRAADLEGAVDVVEQRLVAVALADDGHESAGVPNDEPLDLARDQERGIGQKVDPGFDRKQHQQRELVQPVEVVGDDDVVARPRDVLLACHLEPEDEPHDRNGHQPDGAIGERRLAADRKEVGGREGGRGHFRWPRVYG